MTTRQLLSDIRSQGRSTCRWGVSHDSSVYTNSAIAADKWIVAFQFQFSAFRVEIECYRRVESFAHSALIQIKAFGHRLSMSTPQYWNQLRITSLDGAFIREGRSTGLRAKTPA